MSTTVQNIIDFAAKEAGILASGEGLNTDENADALIALNAMLNRWAIEEAVIFGERLFSAALTGSQGEYQIGTSATFNTNRPIKIRAARVIGSNGVSYPLELIDVNEWNAIPEKTLTGVQPMKLYCDYQYPLAKVYLWPRPSGTPTLELWMWQEISEFTAVTDVYDMPKGYLQAIHYNLALHLCNMFSKPVPPDIKEQAMVTKQALASLNESNLIGPTPTTLQPPQPPQQ